MKLSGDSHLQTIAQELDDDGLYAVIEAIIEIEDEQKTD
jgi:hypothetical protein